MMEEAGSIFAFINFNQAAHFGHVAWGFQLEADNFYFGSTDHLWKHDWWDLGAWWRYMDVPPHGDIDYWAGQGTRAEMLSIMSRGPHIRYHAYKELELQGGTPQEAANIAKQLQIGGWNLARHNCVHQAFLVLSNYHHAHGIPNPFTDPLNLIPKTWFKRIEAELKQL